MVQSILYDKILKLSGVFIPDDEIFRLELNPLFTNLKAYNLNDFNEIVIKSSKYSLFAFELYKFGLYWRENLKNYYINMGYYNQPEIEVIKKRISALEKIKSILEIDDSTFNISVEYKSFSDIKINNITHNLEQIKDDIISNIILQSPNLGDIKTMNFYSIKKVKERLEEFKNNFNNRYLTGRGVFVSTSNLICHICIQLLVNFLNFEEYLFSDKLNIDEIKISDNNCLFIYNFLQYFELYSFTSENNNKDIQSFRKIIRRRFNSFPFENNKLEGEMIKKIRFEIFEFRIHYKNNK